MATRKIEEAIRQLYREGDRPLRDAALEELVALRYAARTWRGDLGADLGANAERDMHDLFTAMAKEGD